MLTGVRQDGRRRSRRRPPHARRPGRVRGDRRPGGRRGARRVPCPVADRARVDPRPGPPRLHPDGRRRRERDHRQCPPATRLPRRAEEPRRGLRADRHRSDVEGATGDRQSRRRDPGPDRRRTRRPVDHRSRTISMRSRRAMARLLERPRARRPTRRRRPSTCRRTSSSATATSPSTSSSSSASAPRSDSPNAMRPRLGVPTGGDSRPTWSRCRRRPGAAGHEVLFFPPARDSMTLFSVRMYRALQKGAAPLGFACMVGRPGPLTLGARTGCPYCERPSGAPCSGRTQEADRWMRSPGRRDQRWEMPRCPPSPTSTR